jgi:hypothetical protein
MEEEEEQPQQQRHDALFATLLGMGVVAQNSAKRDGLMDDILSLLTRLLPILPRPMMQNSATERMYLVLFDKLSRDNSGPWLFDVFYVLYRDVTTELENENSCLLEFDVASALEKYLNEQTLLYEQSSELAGLRERLVMLYMHLTPGYFPNELLYPLWVVLHYIAPENANTTLLRTHPILLLLIDKLLKELFFVKKPVIVAQKPLLAAAPIIDGKKKSAEREVKFSASGTSNYQKMAKKHEFIDRFDALSVDQRVDYSIGKGEHWCAVILDLNAAKQSLHLEDLITHKKRNLSFRDYHWRRCGHTECLLVEQYSSSKAQYNRPVTAPRKKSKKRIIEEEDGGDYSVDSSPPRPPKRVKRPTVVPEKEDVDGGGGGGLPELKFDERSSSLYQEMTKLGVRIGSVEELRVGQLVDIATHTPYYCAVVSAINGDEVKLHDSIFPLDEFKYNFNELRWLHCVHSQCRVVNRYSPNAVKFTRPPPVVNTSPVFATITATVEEID